MDHPRLDLNRHSPAERTFLAVPKGREWHAERMTEEADIRERVAAVVHSWVDPIPGRVSVELTDSHFWDLRPTSPQASPLWVAGSSAWNLTVGFGRSGSRIELGYSSKVTDEEALESLDEIGRAVIAGRLTEWRRGKSGSRWELVLPDGTVTHGSTNWVLPLRWRRATEEHFAPY